MYDFLDEDAEERYSETGTENSNGKAGGQTSSETPESSIEKTPRKSWIVYPFDGVRYILMLILLVSSAVLINAGNSTGQPLLFIVAAYAAWEAAQRIAGARMLSGQSRIQPAESAEALENQSNTKILTVPFNKSAKKYAAGMISAGIIFSLIIFFAGAIAGISAVQMFLVACSVMLFFAAAPAFTAITMTTAKTMQSLSGKGALFLDAEKMENFSDVSVIMADKDAFIIGKPEVTSIYVDGKLFTIEDGNFRLDGKPVKAKRYPDLSLALACGMMANNSALEPAPKGEPEEIALLEAAKAGELNDQRAEYKSLEYNFSRERHLVTAGYRIRNKNVYYAAGSLDKIISISSRVLSDGAAKRLSNGEQKTLMEIHRQIEKRGNNMIALAVKRTLPGKKYSESDFMIVALVTMRSEVDVLCRPAVEKLENAGIKVILAADYDRGTAVAMAEKSGISAESEEVITGQQIEAMSDDELYKKAPYIQVVAATSAKGRLRLIQAFQRMGHSVAYAGSRADDLILMENADAAACIGECEQGLKYKTGAEMKKGLESISDAIEEAGLARNMMQSAINYSMLLPFSLAMLTIFLVMAVSFGFTATMFSVVQTMWAILILSIAAAFTGLGKMKEFLKVPPFQLQNASMSSEMSAAFAKSAVISMIPMVAMLAAGTEINPALLVSYAIIALSIGLLTISRGIVIAGVIIAIAIHTFLSQFIPAFATIEMQQWAVVIISAMISLTIIGALSARKKAFERQLRTHKMIFAPEGWKEQEVEDMHRRAKEMGKR